MSDTTSSNLARARFVAESIFAKIEAECDKHGGLAPAYSVRIATPDITNALDAAEQRGRATGRREGLEEAAGVCEERGVPTRDPRMSGIEEGARYCAEDIRSLAAKVTP